MDNDWEQRKLEARKMLKNGDETHQPGARLVGLTRHFRSSFVYHSQWGGYLFTCPMSICNRHEKVDCFLVIK
jgi:hypothetical protein